MTVVSDAKEFNGKYSTKTKSKTGEVNMRYLSKFLISVFIICSLTNILSCGQSEKEKNEAQKLKLEVEKLELEKKQNEARKEAYKTDKLQKMIKDIENAPHDPF